MEVCGEQTGTERLGCPSNTKSQGLLNNGSPLQGDDFDKRKILIADR